MPLVEMPDGGLVEMPDNPTAEQLQALRAKVESMPQAKPQEPVKPPNPLLQTAKTGLAGVGQGIAALPTLFAEKLNSNPVSTLVPGPMGKLMETVATLGGRKLPQAFEPGALQSAVKSLDIPPTTPGQSYAHSIGEGIGGALTVPIGGPVAAMVQGGITGLGAEASAQAFGEKGKPNALARVLGGLGAGGLTGALSGILPQRTNVAREIMRDVRPQDFQQAVAGMERNAGTIPTNLAQTMPNASNIDSAVELLANSRYGRRTAEMLRGQGVQAELDMEGMLSTLPGTIRSEQQVANAGQEAMTEALRNAKNARTAAVTPLYNRAGDLPGPVISGLRNTLAEMVMAPGTSIDTIRTIQALGRELLESSATGLPRTHARDIKAAIDDTIRAGIKNTVNPASPKTQGELKHLTSQLYEQLGEASPSLAQANRLYRQITETEINPLKQSAVGRIAGTSGYQADKEAALSKVFQLFERGTLPGAETSDILNFERAARGVNPAVYQDAAKTWIASKINNAIKSDTARGPENISKALVAAFGDPSRVSKEWRTMEDVMAGLARSQGVAENTYVDGFRSLMRLNAELAIRPSSVSGVTPGALGNLAKDSALTRAGSTSFIAPLRQPALATARLIGASVLRDADRWLTTPEGAATLARLGRQPYMSPGWVKTLQTLAATTAVNQSEE